MKLGILLVVNAAVLGVLLHWFITIGWTSRNIPVPNWTHINDKEKQTICTRAVDNPDAFFCAQYTAEDQCSKITAIIYEEVSKSKYDEIISAAFAASPNGADFLSQILAASWYPSLITLQHDDRKQLSNFDVKSSIVYPADSSGVYRFNHILDPIDYNRSLVVSRGTLRAKLTTAVSSDPRYYQFNLADGGTQLVQARIACSKQTSIESYFKDDK